METTADVVPTTPLSPTRSELDSTELEEERELIFARRASAFISNPFRFVYSYAMRRNSDSIKVWFWPAGSEPKDVSGSKVIDESTWGTASAVFPSSDQCDLDAHFAAHQIVINLTYCGDWAGTYIYS